MQNIKKYREIVFTDIKQFAGTLEHADKSLKKDLQIILTASNWHGYALEYADESLRNNRKISQIFICNKLKIIYSDKDAFSNLFKIKNIDLKYYSNMNVKSFLHVLIYL